MFYCLPKFPSLPQISTVQISPTLRSNSTSLSKILQFSPLKSFRTQLCFHQISRVFQISLQIVVGQNLKPALETSLTWWISPNATDKSLAKFGHVKEVIRLGFWLTAIQGEICKTGGFGMEAELFSGDLEGGWNWVGILKVNCDWGVGLERSEPLEFWRGWKFWRGF